MIYFALSSSQIRLLLLTGFIVGLIGIFGTFFIHFGLGESGYNFLGKTKKVTLAPGMPVFQTFTAKENNLYQVRFVLKNAHLRHGEHIDIALMDGVCTQIIATTKLATEPMKQGTYNVFSFPPIPTSRDARYCFSATFFSDISTKGERPYLSATDTQDPIFSDRTLTDSNKGKTYESHTLFLRPAYTKGSLKADLGSLLDRLSQYKPTSFKGLPILILFVLLIIESAIWGIMLFVFPTKK